MHDAVIDEAGATVAIELLWMRHRRPQITDCDTVEEAFEWAEAIEDGGSGATVAILVSGVPRHILGPVSDAEVIALYREVHQVEHAR